ncbi:abortive infection family protein [Psychrobacter sanguinis]|uniref:abortive infection family protein n=1 Tax=Psychrobacter sanguinis TaxID=861445 RepID=UPI00020C9345|nr:abortive infection family protein [Psychrobacter sanguinis]EGK15311.1 abortive phage resistance protein [Psychrobacter sp. 1501(2011)]MCD9151406.1 abortive infection family protein [Psychrobacter sanguinis]
MNNILKELPTLYDQIQGLQNILISRATGGECNDSDYTILRKIALESNFNHLVPSFVRHARDLNQFWQVIKHKYDNYADRRTFIYSEFQGLLTAVEFDKSGISPNFEKSIETINSGYIDNMWKKAIERKSNDPEGAITLSRSLIESVCKHILDLERVSYDKNSDLSELYKRTSELLKMSANQYESNLVFKQILGGCSGIVNGLGQLRNNVGDAHGQGVINVSPKPRHAELAVNLAGAMSHFLLSSYQESYKKQ